ncbi:MAG: helix-turn-helix transcriptional regulator [Firmicutes bacterium]|nr:helix-turn-helix transcriptional regulator [Bacillota bacterium]
MSINTNLIRHRDSKGWTQEQLAEAIGVSRSTVAKWEAGKGTPKVENLIVLSRVLDVSIDSLLMD